jgi:hypothetical protein
LLLDGADTYRAIFPGTQLTIQQEAGIGLVAGIKKGSKARMRGKWKYLERRFL